MASPKYRIIAGKESSFPFSTNLEIDIFMANTVITPNNSNMVVMIFFLIPDGINCLANRYTNTKSANKKNKPPLLALAPEPNKEGRKHKDN